VNRPSGREVRYFAAALPVDEGRKIPRRSHDMTSPTTATTPVVISLPRAGLQLAMIAFFAFVAYYFIGVDQGMSSVFGNNMYLHEFLHDGRHLLGFPCH
jgi:hypothetical protein